MLERALFEDMIDAHWVTVERELAEKRFDEHLRHGAILFGDAARHHPEQYDPKDLPTVDENQRKALNKVFGQVRPQVLDRRQPAWPSRRRGAPVARWGCAKADAVLRKDRPALQQQPASRERAFAQLDGAARTRTTAIAVPVSGRVPRDVEKALFTSLWTADADPAAGAPLTSTSRGPRGMSSSRSSSDGMARCSGGCRTRSSPELGRQRSVPVR